MGNSWSPRVALFLAGAMLAGGLAVAQQASDEGKRKIKSRVNPQYAELAKKMNISGRVRIEIVIAPDGHVKSAKAVGGHPLLVQSCLDAVGAWKFESAPEETTQIVEFEFKGQQ